MWRGARSPQVLICPDCDTAWMQGPGGKGCWVCGRAGIWPLDDRITAVTDSGPNEASVGQPMPV